MEWEEEEERKLQPMRAFVIAIGGSKELFNRVFEIWYTHFFILSTLIQVLSTKLGT